MLERRGFDEKTERTLTSAIRGLMYVYTAGQAVHSVSKESEAVQGCSFVYLPADLMIGSNNHPPWLDSDHVDAHAAEIPCGWVQRAPRSAGHWAGRAWSGVTSA